MLTQAKTIKTALSSAFKTAALDALATLDPTEAGPALSACQPVAIITAPALTFPAAQLVEATWEIWLIAGPAQAIEAAWTQLDNMLAATRLAVEVTGARPETFQPAQGQGIPALACTFTTTYYKE